MTCHIFEQGNIWGILLNHKFITLFTILFLPLLLLPSNGLAFSEHFINLENNFETDEIILITG